MLDRWTTEIEDLEAASDGRWRVLFHVFSNTGEHMMPSCARSSCHMMDPSLWTLLISLQEMITNSSDYANAACAGWLCYGGLLQRLDARCSHVLSQNCICGIVCDSCPEPTVRAWPEAVISSCTRQHC